MNPNNSHQETSRKGTNPSTVGGSSLGQSNPLRTISNPTDFHGVGRSAPITSNISGTSNSIDPKSTKDPSHVLEPQENHVKFAPTAKINVPKAASSQTGSSVPSALRPSSIKAPPPPPPPIMKPTTTLRSPPSNTTKKSSEASSSTSSPSMSSIQNKKNAAKSIMRKMKPSVPSGIAKTAKKKFGSSQNSNKSTTSNLTQAQLAQLLNPNAVTNNNNNTTLATKPTLSIDDETNKFLSPHSLHPPPLHSSESPLQTLEQLVQRRAWGDVLHLSLDFLTSQSYQHGKYYKELQQLDSNTPSDNNLNPVKLEGKEREISEETCLIIAYRLQAMMKCKRFMELQREIASLHLLTAQFPIPGKFIDKGSDLVLPQWLLFGLVIVAAQSLVVIDDSRLAASTNMESKILSDLSCLDVLHRLQYALEISSLEDGPTHIQRDWKMRLDLALSNAFIQKEEYRMALDVLDKILMNSSLKTLVKHNLQEVWKEWLSASNKDSSGDGMMEEESDVSLLSKLCYFALRIELLSRQMRIFLQLGAISEAQSLQDEILREDYQSFNQLCDSITSSPRMVKFKGQFLILQQTPTQVHLNNGLLSFANLDYEDAITHFQSAVSAQRERSCSSPKSATAKIHSHILSTGILNALDLQDDPHILTHVFNNLALCSLYTCQVNLAVSMMEDFIKENPTLYLTETLVFNLCTLYELCADSAMSGRKKKVLQGVAKRFFLHDISMENFRIG